MISTSHDISHVIDPVLQSLFSTVARTAAEGDISWFLAGAMGRDLVLECVYGMRAGRATRDVDIGVMVDRWPDYEALKGRLCETSDFSPDTKTMHRLRYRDSYQVDLIPFGAVEHEDGSIAWPPGYDIKMRVSGFKDAWRYSIRLHIGGHIEIPVVSLPGLMLLKLIAWEARHVESPKKDASDIALLLQKYSDAGNIKRLYEEYQDILEAEDFDITAAGARLLGRDLARLLGKETKTRVLDILEHETEPEQSEILVYELAEFFPDRNSDTALSLLRKLKQGVLEAEASRV